MGKEYTRLVIMSDSIADCGRARPVGEGFPDALGSGYPRLLDAMAKVEHPEWRLRLANMGTSGDRSRDLCARWETDCLALHPDWILVAIGINDVWRYFDSPRFPEQHVSAGEYEENLRNMAESARAAGSGMIFASLYFLETDKNDPMRAMADTYRARMAAVARETGAPYIDLQEAFDAQMSVHSSYVFAADRVHPAPAAQYLIAREIFRTLEKLL